MSAHFSWYATYYSVNNDGGEGILLALQTDGHMDRRTDLHSLDFPHRADYNGI